jgi:hypothetical protein
VIGTCDEESYQVCSTRDFIWCSCSLPLPAECVFCAQKGGVFAVPDGCCGVGWCVQVSFGQMVGCENEDCLIEWFHFECVGLKEKVRAFSCWPQCKRSFAGRADADDMPS